MVLPVCGPVAEMPGPLPDSDSLSEPLEDPEDQNDDEPLDLPDEPSPPMTTCPN